MKRILTFIVLVAAVALIGTSCFKDLDTKPIDPDVVTAATVFDDPANYKYVLAKLYAGLAISGQEGPSGQPDITSIDEGFGQYLRGYWYHQELPTDEAVIGWNDQTIKDFHSQNWGSSDVFITAFYYRIFYQIALANEYIRETSDEKLAERGQEGSIKEEVQLYRAEARWLRALSYWHALDVFGNVPFVTEDDLVGFYFPAQITRSNLFIYIENELLEIEPLLKPARGNEYGRADQACVWMLLAKLYLNAEVYIGTPKYTECLTYLNKIIDAGYSLHSEYKNLFMADNGPAYIDEVIFSVNFDGINTTTYGGTNFIIHAAVGGDMDPEEYGISGGWGGTRTTKALVEKFSGTDDREMFFTEGQNLEIEDISLFNDGYAVVKFTNARSDGQEPSSLEFVDTDFPMFRLADVYLMYAEAVLRGGSGGTLGEAEGFINDLRDRANAGAVNGIDLDFILDERARELYWECHRRTDLVRYGLLTGGEYLWPWKGNVMDGTATDEKYNLFPIPAADLTANPNLVQNPGY
jgi:hypothetical protein